MMEKIFEISMHVEEPIVVGQDNQVGRRQLIPIVSGTVKSNQRFWSRIAVVLIANVLIQQENVPYLRDMLFN